MQEHFDPDVVRREHARQLYAALSSATTLERNHRQRELELGRLFRAAGAWETYQCDWDGFEIRKWLKALWAAGTFVDLEAAFEQLSKSRQQAEARLVSMVAEGRSRNYSAPNLGEHAITLIRERMDAECFSQGCLLALNVCDKRVRSRGTNKNESTDSGMDLHASQSQRLWTVYRAAVESTYDYDEQMQRDLVLLSTAPREEVREMRSLFFGRRTLPWWLDGRVELIALARSYPDVWKSCERLVAENTFSGRTVAEIMRRIGGAGHRVGSPSGKLRDKKGVLCNCYSWHMQDGGGGVVEVLEPVDSRRRYITARLRTSDGSKPAESSWLMGRMMLLNGRMLHWTKACPDSVVGVGLETAGDPLPKKGMLVLADLHTQRILEPVEGVAYRDE